MMISSLNYSSIPSDELFTLGKRTVALAESKRASIPAIVPFLDRLIDKCRHFQSALERESKNPLIGSQSNTDKFRINAYVSFRDLCDLAKKRKRTDIAEAGLLLIAVFRKHGWSIQTMGQKTRTASILNVISEIKTKYQHEVILVGGEEYLADLELTQNDYEQASKAVVELASANNEPTVTETRPELVASLKATYQIISLQEISFPSDDVTALIASLNQLITTSVATIKASDTRAENAKKKTAATPVKTIE